MMKADDQLQSGLSVRDYIAIEAMKQYMVGPYSQADTPEKVVRASYKMADAMIEQSEEHDGE